MLPSLMLVTEGIAKATVDLSVNISYTGLQQEECLHSMPGSHGINCC